MEEYMNEFKIKIYLLSYLWKRITQPISAVLTTVA